MRHQYQEPHANIAQYVKTVLIIEDIAKSDTLPVFPMGVTAFVCLSQGENKINCRISGKPINAETLACGTTSLIAYFFNPFMSGVLFGIAHEKLVEKDIPLQEWSHKKATLLEERLTGATANERLGLLDQFMLEQILKQKNACEIIRLSTDRITANPSKHILSDIQRELKITEKTLQRVFKKYVGVTPNRFRRICQFHSAFQQVRSQQFTSLSDIAFKQEYADQSHFIRSFREFTDLSPNEYVKYGLREKKK